MGAPVVGELAPPFASRDQHGTPVSSADFVGRTAVLVVFFPWAFSRICGGELCSLRDDLPRFASADVQVVGISCDAMFSLRTWADTEGFGFPLLTDHWPHGAIASSYGVFDAVAGAALRGTFLIDREGVLRWSQVKGIGEERSADDYATALATI